MQEEQSPKVMNFSEINPYEMMYRNMNITVNDMITKEHAEIVARQLGYMHNAFGVIVKDFIKILAIKFQEAPQRDHPDRRNCNAPGGFNSKMPNSEAMDIEEHSVSPRPARPKQKQPERERPVGERREPVVQLKPNKQQQKPPNIDLFGEFAFEKDAYEVIKKPKQSKEGKEPTQLQEKFSKIIEDVKKKKKDGKKADQVDDYEPNSRDRSERGGNRFMNAEVEESRPGRPQFPLSNEPKPTMFDNFEFDLNIPPQPNPLQPLLREKPDALWELANLAPKEKPPIYEISDDQN